MNYPNIILLFSGKRKSGKDFIAEKLFTQIGNEKCNIIRISEPIKIYYAKEKNLYLEGLMSHSAYKETYRKEMIEWSDEIRKVEPGYFCKAACNKAVVKSIWIVSDIRRKSDIEWFKNTYGDKIRTVRINANTEVRKSRGWNFTEGVDDVASECDLDDYTSWDLEVTNNNAEEFESAIKQIVSLIQNI